jgi:hypothetical protein
MRQFEYLVILLDFENAPNISLDLLLRKDFR